MSTLTDNSVALAALERIYGKVPFDTWERVASGEILPPWPLPEIVEATHQSAKRDELTNAMKGAVLVEQGTGWVKVHGLDDAAPLSGLLETARLSE